MRKGRWQGSRFRSLVSGARSGVDSGVEEASAEIEFGSGLQRGRDRERREEEGAAEPSPNLKNFINSQRTRSQ